MIDEKTELRLVAAPMRRPVKGKAQEQDIGRGEIGSARKESAGEEREHERDFENCGEPRQHERDREAGGGDIVRCRPHAHELEAAGHQKDGAEDQPGHKYRHGFCHCSFALSCRAGDSSLSAGVQRIICRLKPAIDAPSNSCKCPLHEGLQP